MQWLLKIVRHVHSLMSCRVFLLVVVGGGGGGRDNGHNILILYT